MKSCPNCQAQLPDENKFCSKCGYKIPEPKFIYSEGYNDDEILFACLKCGSQFSSEDGKFCPQCGNQLPNSINDPNLRSNDPSLMYWFEIDDKGPFKLEFPKHKKFVNNGTLKLPFVCYLNGNKPTIITEIETAAWTYDDKPYINTIKIPITIRKIDEELTYGIRFDNLSIEIPKNNLLEYIGSKTFKSTSNHQELDIGNLFDSLFLKKIGYEAFSRRKLRSSIMLPYFLGNKLRNIVILPDSIIEICTGAFKCCDATIIVPESIEKIGEDAFKDCIIYYKGSLKDKDNWGAKEFYNYYPEGYKKYKR